MRRAPTRTLALAAAAGLLLAGCSASESAPEPAPGAVSEPAVAGLPARIDYVALGDSYSAAPMVTTMRSDPSGCLRSTDNYPAFLAGWLDVASYTDVTCSAATTGDVVGRQRLLSGERTAPQLDAVTAATDLVTIGLGGNDFGIFAALIECRDSTGCPAGLVRQMAGDAARVQQRIARTVRRVAERAPDAAVLVVGYPQVLPERGSCPAAVAGAGRLDAVNRVARRLNEALRRGAEAAGASYVDLDGASAGHDVCAGRRAWINGPEPKPGVAAPFHPYLAGMRGVAGEVYRELTGQDAPDAERAAPDDDARVRNPAPAGVS